MGRIPCENPGSAVRPPMKIWLLTNTPSPYQVELLSAINADGRCRLSVRFMRDVHRGSPWQPAPGQDFGYRILRGCGPRVWSDAFRIHPAALRECATGTHDLYVISGQYTSLTAVACGLLLSLRRKPWALWLEQPWPEDYRPTWTRSVAARSEVARVLRLAILRMMLRLTRRVFCIGTAAVEAYGRLGTPTAKLGLVPYCCDTDRYARVDPAAAAKRRGELAPRARTVFLFSGQLIERKGVDILLDAFSRLAAETGDVALVLMGDGPARSKLESSVPPPLRDRVRFLGNVPYDDVPLYFRAADVFVFPSRHDGWGVVINEACAAGLPIITTSAVGAARDLVVDGYNGFVLPRDDANGFLEKMRQLGQESEQARLMGERSLQIVQKLSLPRGVELFLENARAALGDET